MGKLSILIVISLIAVLALFAVFNNDSTSINVPFGQTYELPKIGIILISAAAGALVTLVIFVIRDTRRYFISYQYQKLRKREARVESLYSKAVNAILGDNEAEARASLDEILKTDPQHTDALLRLGNLSMLKGKYEEAEASYRKALMTAPDNIEALFSLEESLSRQKRPAEAMKCLDKVLELDPNNHSALFKKRGLLEKEGRWLETIDVQKAILKVERNPESLDREEGMMLGFKYELSRDSLERGEMEKANKGFRSILRDEPGFVPAYLGVAEVILNEGNTEGAVSFIEKAYEATRSQILLARLEDLLISLGEPARLIRTYRNAVAASPNNHMLKFFLGKLYFRLEMVDDAFETLESVEMSEGYPDTHKLLGELYLRRDQCAKAVTEFKKTIELDKTLRVPYGCSHCCYTDVQWSGRCPRCGLWNTYRFDLGNSCKEA